LPVSISKFISGNRAFAGLLAAAAISVAAPAWASTDTTVTWNFFGGSQANSDIGKSATFTGTESPPNSLSNPLSGDLSITAYGYQVATTTTTTANYQWSGNWWQGYRQTGQPTVSTSYGSATATDLYNKANGGTESGLGLAGFADNEISDTRPTQLQSSVSFQNNWTDATVTSSIEYNTGVIQIDLTSLEALLGFANNNDATLTIGSLQSPDTAVISASTTLGVIGTQIATVASAASGLDQSTTLSLSQLTGDQYLSITAAAAGTAGQWCQPGTPGQTVLLSTLTLTLPSNSGNPTPAAPAPVPATAGLVLAGALGMGMMMLKRRQRLL
jgi:hypothetical protein